MFASTSRNKDSHLRDSSDHKVPNFRVVSAWEAGQTGESILRFELGLPRTERSHRDELIDPLNDASDGCDNFIAIHVSAMPPENY